jgi:hypothetical protein
MGSRKEHHFLAQFYQKNFSVDQEDIYISFYNVNTGLYLKQAPISGQAKSKYLYGKDDVMESKLEKLEGACSKIIRSIIDDNRLPSDYADLHLLGKFILYQQARTVQHSKIMNEAFGSLNQSMFGDVAPDDEMTVREMLELMEQRLPYLAHLDYTLVINDTPVPFITSDNPVVLYNRMMEIKRHTTPGAWANMGLPNPLSSKTPQSVMSTS